MNYNSKTGEIIGVRGNRVGSLTSDGYIKCYFQGKKVLAHRLAWRLHYGVWPSGSVDHINGVKTDNRISNLRIAKASENQWNTGRRKNNKTGFKGVYFDKESERFIASIQVNKKRYRSRGHLTKEAASLAYQKMAMRNHGEFYRSE